MTKYARVFSNLKDVKIDTIFNDFNRQFVLDISSGSCHPISSEHLSDIFDDISDRMKDMGALENLDFVEESKKFVSEKIGDAAFRYHHISIPSYSTEIDYFVSLEDMNNLEECHPAYTKIDSEMVNDVSGESSDKIPGVFATIVVLENHDCITDDTFGKIVKHELTHVMCETIHHVLDVDVYEDHATNESILDRSNEEDSKDIDAFEEFLCDYIQWDATVGPNEDPVEKFKEIMKKYLTWIASDLYKPYIEGVDEYYRESTSKEREESDDTV